MSSNILELAGAPLRHAASRPRPVRPMHLFLLLVVVVLGLPSPVKAQLERPTGDRTGECNAERDLTCGPANGVHVCCRKDAYICGTRADNGAPRCQMCPQICMMDCENGYSCQPDANGCHTCLPAKDGGDGDNYVRNVPCNTKADCLVSQLCHAGFCRKDPCVNNTCTGLTPVCNVTADLKAVCNAAAIEPPRCNVTGCGIGFTCTPPEITGDRWRCVKNDKSSGIPPSKQIRRPARRSSVVRPRKLPQMRPWELRSQRMQQQAQQQAQVAQPQPWRQLLPPALTLPGLRQQLAQLRQWAPCLLLLLSSKPQAEQQLPPQPSSPLTELHQQAPTALAEGQHRRQRSLLGRHGITM